MPRVIFVCQHLKGGGRTAAKRTFYVNYISTRQGVEILPDSKTLLPATWKQKEFISQLLTDFPDAADCFEYEDYIATPNRANASSFIAAALEQNMPLLGKRKNYVDYIANRSRVERVGEHGLFSSKDEAIVLDRVVQTAANHPGTIWTPIISLRREDAARLGYDNAASWRDFLTGYAKDLAVGLKIDLAHFRWYAAFHDEGNHPHVHMICWSIDPHEGFLSVEGIRKIKAGLANELFRDELMHVYQEQTKYRHLLSAQAKDEMMALIAKMQTGMVESVAVETLTQNLVEKLRTHKGKMQYGYLQASVKEIVDAIVDEMAKTGPAAEAYTKWCEMRLEVLRTYMKDPPPPGPLSKQKELKHIRNIVVAEAAKLARGEFVFEPTPIDRAEFPDGEDDGAHENERHHSEPWYLPYRHAKKKLNEARESEVAEERRALVSEAVDMFGQATIGDPYGVAAFALGRLYLKGDDLPRDVFEAVRWLERSCEQGSSYAQYALAMLYLKDGEIAKDVPRAISLLEQSAEDGNAFAFYRLGRLYLEGADVPKDVVKAVEYLTASAEHGNQYAQYTLGKLYLMGIDIPRDREAARHWLEASAAQGNEYARFFLDRFDSFRDPSVITMATRLLRHLGRVFQENPPDRGRPSGSESKQRRKEREKKIAQGHAEDEHEQQMQY
jgi:hypothetical protein